jgi:hypothetical protein
MDLRDDGEVSKLPHGDPRLGQITGAISSLKGAMHAVLLLQNGHGDLLASDIAGFIMKEPQS